MLSTLCYARKCSLKGSIIEFDKPMQCYVCGRTFHSQCVKTHLEETKDLRTANGRNATHLRCDYLNGEDVNNSMPYNINEKNEIANLSNRLERCEVTSSSDKAIDKAQTAVEWTGLDWTIEDDYPLTTVINQCEQNVKKSTDRIIPAVKITSNDVITPKIEKESIEKAQNQTKAEDKWQIVSYKKKKLVESDMKEAKAKVKSPLNAFAQKAQKTPAEKAQNQTKIDDKKTSKERKAAKNFEEAKVKNSQSEPQKSSIQKSQPETSEMIVPKIEINQVEKAEDEWQVINYKKKTFKGNTNERAVKNSYKRPRKPQIPFKNSVQENTEETLKITIKQVENKNSNEPKKYSENSLIRYEAFKAKRQGKIKDVWIEDGLIWMRKNIGDSKVEATSVEQVHNLASATSISQSNISINLSNFVVKKQVKNKKRK